MRQTHFNKEQKRRQRDRFAWVDYFIIENKNLTSSAKVVYLVLARFANNETQECHPSINTIAEMANLHPDTVRTAVRDLQREKLIEIDDSVRGEVFYYQLNNIPSTGTTGKSRPLGNNGRGYRKKGVGVVENKGTNNTNINNTNITNISKDTPTNFVGDSNPPLISNLSPKQEKDDIFPKEYYKDIETIFQNELEKKYNLKYAFNYSKERTVLKRFTKLVLKKHPDWGLEEIVKRVPALITHWIENNEKEAAPTITKVFSTNHLNEYRFWIAQNYPHKVKSSL